MSGSQIKLLARVAHSLSDLLLVRIPNYILPFIALSAAGAAVVS